jgi:hypothetical protein
VGPLSCVRTYCRWVAVWTARVATINDRQVIVVCQHGFFYGEYSTPEEMAAAGVDLAELELRE